MGRRKRRSHTRPSLFHDRREHGEMTSVTATDAKNEFGRVLETAIQEGGVVITKHDAPRAVLLSLREFDALVSSPESRLDTLRSEFDSLLARMQTPKARSGMRAAFKATSARLGAAAVTAAKRG